MTQEERPPMGEVLQGLFEILSVAAIWHDVTDECPIKFEEPVVKVCLTGFDTKLSPLFALVRWLDGDETLLSISNNHPDSWKKVPLEEGQVRQLFSFAENLA